MFYDTSYYPLHPTSEDVNLDYERFESHCFMPVTPDVLIVPSDLRYFMKVRNSNLFYAALNQSGEGNHNFSFRFKCLTFEITLILF